MTSTRLTQQNRSWESGQRRSADRAATHVRPHCPPCWPGSAGCHAAPPADFDLPRHSHYSGVYIPRWCFNISAPVRSLPSSFVRLLQQFVCETFQFAHVRLPSSFQGMFVVRLHQFVLRSHTPTNCEVSHTTWSNCKVSQTKVVEL